MPDQQRMFTIVVASGASSRYGKDKLDEIIGSKTVLDHSIDTALSVSDGVVVVTDSKRKISQKIYAQVQGGLTRSESVKKGLEAIPADVEIIAIHDGARPLVPANVYLEGKKIIQQGSSGAIPAIAVVDTIKKVDVEQNKILNTVDRSTLRAVQTPQIFNANIIRKAHQELQNDTDDSALVEKLGYDVTFFDGDQHSHKLTTPHDLDYLKVMLNPNQSQTITRIGNGYDIHPFGEDQNKKLILGGIEFDHVGLVGHSDSDAVSHGLTDAILSAIGAPDLGTLFPASDQKNKGESSLKFLEKAVQMAANDGYKLSNAVIIIMAEKPKLGNAILDMTKKLTESLEPIWVRDSQLTITPKHGEGVGEIGKAQAIAVHASINLFKTTN